MVYQVDGATLLSDVEHMSQPRQTNLNVASPAKVCPRVQQTLAELHLTALACSHVSAQSTVLLLPCR